MEQLSNPEIYPEVSFTAHTPLIFLIPEFERHYLKREEKNLWSFGKSNRHIVLPMLAYRILIPFPSDPELNLFQLTVLKMMQIKNYNNEQLAEKLCLHVTLIELVIQQLTEKCLLQNRQLTESGKKYLSGNDYEMKYKTGYILYDITSESFLDDFAEDNFYKTYDYERKGNNFHFNAAKSVSEDQSATDVHALLIHNIRNGILPPDLPHEKSMRICQKIIRRFWNDENHTDDSIDTEEESSQRFNLSNYSVRIVSTPEPVYTVTFIRAYQNDNWNVYSPFCPDISSSLTKNFHERFRKQLFPEEFNKLLYSLHHQKGQAENEKNNDSRHEQKKQYRERVRNMLSPCLKDENTDNLIVSLADAVQAWQKLRTDSVRKEDYTNKLSQYILGCYSAMEYALFLSEQRSLRHVRETMPDFNCKNYLTKDMESNQKILCISAKNYGFYEKEGINWKNLFSRISPNAVSGQNQEPKLEYLLSSGLLLAKHDDTHPFRQTEQLAKRREFLEDMMLLKNYRDPFSHEIKISFSFEDTHLFMQDVLHYTAWLLGLPEEKASLDTLTEQTPETVRSVQRVDEKTYNDCLYEIERNQIDISVKDGLIQYLAGCLLAFRTENKREFVKKSALFLENYIRCFRKESDAEIIRRFTFENQMNDPDVIMSELCDSLHCLPEHPEELTRFFSNANIFHYQKKPVCSKLLFDAVLCAEHYPETHFAKFISGRSAFISDVCHFHLLRGHSAANVSETFSEEDHRNAEQALRRFYEYTRWIQKSY